MNFEGLNPSLAEYAPPLHPALDPVLDPHLNPSLVELDPEGVSLEGIPVPESVHLMEGMYSELHTAVSEVGVPVSVSHFDLHEEMLWVGNHGVGGEVTVGNLGSEVWWNRGMVCVGRDLKAHPVPPPAMGSNTFH
ncbi:hypothetical protein WISP_00269 [Willisornis vidua]|uniref:PAN2-PAN3 deadenylation complex catalytic subunit PAN2 N-terminal domain-containing protein n=1 Tax=Willisornis vidua TaxID=1566151 RepID=A0ABQ9CJH8_9PASS|nr:hypothetical protein WISP_00269 [Willisornis vidua]